MSSRPKNDLEEALRAFEATEANIGRLETLWTMVEKEFPTGNVFQAEPPQYEDACRSYKVILDALPAIDGWKPDETPPALSDVNSMTLDALEAGEFESQMLLHDRLSEPGRQLREYRFRFNRQRRQLVRQHVLDHMDAIDNAVQTLERSMPKDMQGNEPILAPEFDTIREAVEALETLLGSTMKRPGRWSDLRRHLHFGLVGDFYDIARHDWPAVRGALQPELYAPDEPIPVAVTDLAALVRSHPKGKVPTRLQWENLTAEQLERLMFALISGASGYENPQWLMHTHAPDRGRDLSVTRVVTDSLGGTTRSRVIIQCRHKLSQSVSPTDVTVLRDQMVHWEPPRVDVLVIATTGRFTADAVATIEKHNVSDRALRIDMWPESHLERLLAERPALIAEFGLR